MVRRIIPVRLIEIFIGTRTAVIPCNIHIIIAVVQSDDMAGNLSKSKSTFEAKVKEITDGAQALESNYEKEKYVHGLYYHRKTPPDSGIQRRYRAADLPKDPVLNGSSHADFTQRITEGIMKVLVINGSPKGKNSVTYQTIRFLQRKFPKDEFEVIHALFQYYMFGIIPICNDFKLSFFR